MNKILWVSNSRRSATGYGNQTNLFAPALKEAGHDIDIFAFYGAEGSPSVDNDGIVTVPKLTDGYGNDIVKAYYDWKTHDLAISLINPWVLDPNLYGAMNWIAWAPVEGEPVYPGDVQVLHAAKRIWAMSRHGEQQFHNAGFTNVDYVPHGVDTEVFKPVDRDEARQRMGKMINMDLSGRYVVAFNAANKGLPSRKGFYEGLKAFKTFKDACPEANALLYLHTDRDGRHGINLSMVLEMVGLAEGVDVVFAPQFFYLAGMLPQNYINDVYNVADVYFHPSHGEGFGIPILEAQAAGCPVIVSNSTAMTELCMSGWVARTTPYMHVPGQLWALPNIGDLLDRLMVAYASKDKEVYRVHARTRAMAYDYRTVVKDYMLPAIARYGELDVAKAAKQSERAAKRAAVRDA